MIYYLYSHDKCSTIAEFIEFDPIGIRNAIIKHLSQFPDDLLEQQKDFVGQEKKKYYGRKCIDLFELNPNTGNPAKCIIKNDKTYHIDLSNE